MYERNGKIRYMDEATVSQQVPQPPVPEAAMICPQCHFPVKPEYYYCPNCGKNLRTPALPTDMLSQVLLYSFSIILPVIFYIAVTKWQGIKYIRSSDEKAKQMGYIALALLILSSVFFFWWSIVQLQGFVQSSLNSSLNSGCGRTLLICVGWWVLMKWDGSACGSGCCCSGDGCC